MSIIDSKFKKGKQWLMLSEILPMLLLFYEKRIAEDVTGAKQGVGERPSDALQR